MESRRIPISTHEVVKANTFLVIDKVLKSFLNNDRKKGRRSPDVQYEASLHEFRFSYSSTRFYNFLAMNTTQKGFELKFCSIRTTSLNKVL